jgi:hypothetical protein
MTRTGSLSGIAINLAAIPRISHALNIADAPALGMSTPKGSALGDFGQSERAARAAVVSNAYAHGFSITRLRISASVVSCSAHDVNIKTLVDASHPHASSVASAHARADVDVGPPSALANARKVFESFVVIAVSPPPLPLPSLSRIVVNGEPTESESLIKPLVVASLSPHATLPTTRADVALALALHTSHPVSLPVVTTSVDGTVVTDIVVVVSFPSKHPTRYAVARRRASYAPLAARLRSSVSSTFNRVNAAPPSSSATSNGLLDVHIVRGVYRYRYRVSVSERGNDRRRARCAVSMLMR